MKSATEAMPDQAIMMTNMEMMVMMDEVHDLITHKAPWRVKQFKEMARNLMLLPTGCPYFLILFCLKMVLQKRFKLFLRLPKASPRTMHEELNETHRCIVALKKQRIELGEFWLTHGLIKRF